MTPVKLCVIADSCQTDQGRYCFWPLLADQVPGVELTIVSIPEFRDNRKVIDFRDYHCIVFSWDVLNGDYWFRGEITKGVIKRAGRTFIPTWVDEGGLIIIEAQCSHWEPSQEAYEAVWRGGGLKVPSYRYYQATTGTAFRLVKRHANHPFLYGFDSKKDLGCKGNYHDQEWFPEWYQLHPTEHHPDKSRTHSGTFTSYKPDWVPLLECTLRHFPVMLVKVHGRGAIVVTTMHLASSGQTQLIGNIVNNLEVREEQNTYNSLAKGNLSEQVLNYHKMVYRREWSRYWVPRFIWTCGFSVLFVIIGISYFASGGALPSGGGGLIVGIITSKYYDDLKFLVSLAIRRLAKSLTQKGI